MYVAPKDIKESYARWEHNVAMTPAHEAMKAVINAALDNGVFYTTDMTETVANALGVTQEQRDADIVPGKTRCVEGGPFAMEVYLARKIVEDERFAKADAIVRDRLALSVGQKIGKLTPNDFKLTRGCIVEAVSDREVTIIGSRGPQKVRIKCSYTALENYIERANRKT